MNIPQSSVPQGVRPGTARVLVTELSGSGQINPTPRPCEDLEISSESYLTPETLEFLCGTQELSEVTSLEMCINTQDNTLGNFGAHLPNLELLKLNNSVIKSIRDLGSSLSQLQVLWMPRCCLEDLDGISSLSTLKELYLAYNRVSDLSQVGMLENLHILDLEGNDVDDLVQIQFLGLCSKLQNLSLDGNPICKSPYPTVPQTDDYSYRAAVRELVPQLRYLDNLRVEEEGLSCSRTMGEDWETLQNSIKDASSTHLDTNYDKSAPLSRPPSARRPSTSLSCVGPRSSQSPRPLTGSRPSTAVELFSPSGSRPGSSDSGLAAEDSESSTLTHGSTKVFFCGNPAQAIRARREKLRTAPTTSTFTPQELPIHVPEHTYDEEEPDEKGRCDVFAELRAWRKVHSRRLHAIKTEKLPQILAIRHSDEEDNEEEDCFDGFRNSSSDEEDEKCSEIQHSPDSLLQSPSPDMDDSSDGAQISSPDSMLLPSPPASAASQAVRKAPGIRTRRLQTELNCIKRYLAAAPVNDKEQEDVLRLRGSNVQLSVSPRTPRPPPQTSMPPCADKVTPCAASRNHLRLSKVVERPPIARPHTASAALQKHYPHRVPEASRRRSQPD
ncbi:leucine-rich repeat-containing protein 56 [Eucyclogobius newberryi]|uniref:leucine-rich repeat-containing protein 56 n=1 Tax=Eucyclogobius newberryi TaxID=166745 RepID=UPI003B5A1708